MTENMITVALIVGDPGHEGLQLNEGSLAAAATVINKQLHAERIVKGTHHRRLHLASWSDLPDGAFVLLDAPSVVVGSHLAEWTTQGYQARHRRPNRGAANVITPPSTVAALRAGYPAQIDDAAR